jgi:hypothetical protein
MVCTQSLAAFNVADSLPERLMHTTRSLRPGGAVMLCPRSLAAVSVTLDLEVQ